MANECQIEEYADLRGNAPVAAAPPLAVSHLSSGGTATLNKSTVLVVITSTIAGTVDFTSTAGVDPTGSLAPVSIAAAERREWNVRGGTKIKFT